jgi:hypothetical protein
VKLLVRVDLVECDVELHLRPVAVEHHRLQPRRLAVQLDRRVRHRLAVHVKDDGVVDDEVVAGLQSGQVVELAVQALPFGRIDVDRVGPHDVLIEQIRTSRADWLSAIQVRRTAAAPDERRRRHAQRQHPCPPRHRSNIQQTRCRPSVNACTRVGS